LAANRVVVCFATFPFLFASNREKQRPAPRARAAGAGGGVGPPIGADQFACCETNISDSKANLKLNLNLNQNPSSGAAAGGGQETRQICPLQLDPSGSAESIQLRSTEIKPSNLRGSKPIESLSSPMIVYLARSGHNRWRR